MLDTHDTLRSVKSGVATVDKGLSVEEIGGANGDGLGGFSLEAELAAPGHVLDRGKGASSNDDHIVVAVTNEHSLSGVDDLREDLLDGIERSVALHLGARVATDKDGASALGPADIVGRVQRGLDISPVEVDFGARRNVEQVAGEAEDVP